MKTTCDMRGFLSFITLRMINKEPCSGEDIRQEIEARKGCRPSPGTIYPVLRSLSEKGLIKEIEEKGNEKRYKITSAGKKELKIATDKFVKMFYDMKEEFAKA